MKNSNASSVTALVAAATIVNGYATFDKEGADSVPRTIFSAAGLLLVFAGIGQFLDWNLALLLAVLHFIATMFTNGLPVIDFLTKLVG